MTPGQRLAQVDSLSLSGALVTFSAAFSALSLVAIACGVSMLYVGSVPLGRVAMDPLRHQLLLALWAQKAVACAFPAVLAMDKVVLWKVDAASFRCA